MLETALISHTCRIRRKDGYSIGSAASDCIQRLTRLRYDGAPGMLERFTPVVWYWMRYVYIDIYNRNIGSAVRTPTPPTPAPFFCYRFFWDLVPPSPPIHPYFNRKFFFQFLTPLDLFLKIWCQPAFYGTFFISNHKIQRYYVNP